MVDDFSVPVLVIQESNINGSYILYFENITISLMSNTCIVKQFEWEIFRLHILHVRNVTSASAFKSLLSLLER